MKKKIYVAGPLFNSAEKAFNEKLAYALEERGFEVYLPQRDGVERNTPPYDTMNPDEQRRALFELNRDTILKSDIFLFILDGRVPDEGACVELGIAYTERYLRKRQRALLGLHTDARAAFMGSKLNPMIKVPLDHVFIHVSELFDFLSA